MKHENRKSQQRHRGYRKELTGNHRIKNYNKWNKRKKLTGCTQRSIYEKDRITGLENRSVESIQSNTEERWTDPQVSLEKKIKKHIRTQNSQATFVKE